MPALVQDFAIVIGGALAILLLAEFVIRHTLCLARHYGFSGAFVGLTILSIGTSLLEIMIHVVGSVQILRTPQEMTTLSALLIGNNIGSDIFQQNFVLPLVALLGTVVVRRRNLHLEVGGLLAASALLWLACLGGAITRIEGGLLVVAYVGYLAYVGRRQPPHLANSNDRPGNRGALTSWLVVVVCFGLMAAVAQPVVAAAASLVVVLPISASMFGVLVLGICAALPELMTALVSILKGQREISAGILIGSNITNPLFSMGLGAAISGYSVPAVTVLYDLPAKIATGLLIYFFFWRHAGLRGPAALLLILAYVGYLIGRGWWFPVDTPS
jgi:cation:H+ antiporter